MSKVFYILLGFLFFSNAANTKETVDEDFIKKFILNNPEIILESLKKYETKLEKNSELEIRELIKSNISLIEKNNKNSTTGDINSGYSLYEFFDYNCGYCKKAHNEVEKLIKKNKIKVIYINLPVLSDSSLSLAKLSLAIAQHSNQKFNKFHEFLLSGKPSESEIKDFIENLGFNYFEIKKKSEDEEFKIILDKNLELANLLKIRGTPAFIINGELVSGYVSEKVMNSLMFN